MVKDANIRSYSARELRARRIRGESGTDLARVRTKTEDELERDIASDRDWAEMPSDWYERARLVRPESKRLISLRLDPDIIEWFKAQGPGYQTRINAVLRVFMEENRDRPRRARHG